MRPLIATVVIPVFGMLAVAVIALAGSGHVVAIHREVVLQQTPSAWSRSW